MESLNGKALILTGGAGGIGRACIECFVERGGTVFVIDSDRTALERVEADYRATPRVTLVYSKLDSPSACAAALEKISLSVYALVHLAGAYDSDGLDAQYRSTWDRAISINLTTAFDVICQMSDRFDSTLISRIVLVTSVAYRRGSINHLGYSASKGGIAGLVRSLSRQLAPRVLVNAVSPGVIETPMTKGIISSKAADLLAEIPLHRWGQAREVASVISFLCSEDASYITGQILNVDGGMVNS